MFDLPEDKDEALRLASLGADALAVILQLVNGATASTAASVITVIHVILDKLSEGYEGKITVDQVRIEMKQLTDSLVINDSAADLALNNKFGSTNK